MKKLIIGNFKMNDNLLTIYEYKNRIIENELLKNLQFCKLILCPAFPYLSFFNNRNNFSLGAQNCSHLNEKSSTGEVSAMMLREFGCEYVIIGHSERRLKLNENSEQITGKIKQALKVGLKIILCIGDMEYNSDTEKNIGEAIDFVLDQCAASLNSIEQQLLKNITLAYEPVWAIGSGIVPNSDYIKRMVAALKQNFPECLVCYGGSANSENVQDILHLCDGILFGKTSLDVDQILKIISELEK